MRLMSNKKDRKKMLGEKTVEGYKYKARVDFGKNISTQISIVIKEKEVNDIIKKKVEELKEIARRFDKKKKNLQYYLQIGKRLLFLDSDLFKDIARYSVFRRIIEEFPEILPEIKNEKVAIKHLDFMYGVAHMKERNLPKATWDQWYEIMKFKDIYKKPKILQQISRKCESGITGLSLRTKIKNLISKNRQSNKGRRIN